MRYERDESRPAIWAEGSQKPPFDPRAFFRAAHKFGREAVAGILQRCGRSAGDMGEDLQAGRLRIPEDRLGRTGRYLPSAESTGRALNTGAGILQRAAELAQPNAFVDAPREVDAAYRDLFRTGPATAQPAAKPQAGPVPEVATTGDTRRAETDELASIRDLLRSPARDHRDTSAPQASAPVSATASDMQTSAAPKSSLSDRLSGGVREALARLIGYWMILFVLPYGAVKAGIAHLKGEDLRKIRKNSD